MRFVAVLDLSYHKVDRSDILRYTQGKDRKSCCGSGNARWNKHLSKLQFGFIEEISTKYKIGEGGKAFSGRIEYHLDLIVVLFYL